MSFSENRRMMGQVNCPACGQTMDEAEIVEQNLVTYYGAGSRCVECSECEEEFYVREYVERVYSVGKTAEEAEELDTLRYKS